ncbi:MAG: hypothetical protein BWZ06_00754 [Bacteroidetes bacterium ADurb.BinA261]|nr:MAG: hypothetical protein BWZ06_00754 [Bacteroidetes bacterium ADurb.BinA261]
MGHDFPDPIDIQNRFDAGIVYRRLYFVQTNILAYCACNFVVDSVSRFGSYDSSSKWVPYEGYVADNIENFMACRFVGK